MDLPRTCGSVDEGRVILGSSLVHHETPIVSLLRLNLLPNQATSRKATELIESVIQQITKELPPGEGDDLSGFCCDAAESLRKARWVEEHSVRTNSDPSCLVDVEAVLGEQAESLQAVAACLKGLWAALAYRGFEASSIEWYRNATVLRFVTVNLRGGYFVTGRVHVSGGPYSRLAGAFERRFGALGEAPSRVEP